MKPPTERLGDLAPAVRGSIVDDLKLSTPVLIFAKEAAVVESSKLVPEVRKFYSGIYGNDEFVLRVSDGVNVLAAAAAAIINRSEPCQCLLASSVVDPTKSAGNVWSASSSHRCTSDDS